MKLTHSRKVVFVPVSTLYISQTTVKYSTKLALKIFRKYCCAKLNIGSYQTGKTPTFTKLKWHVTEFVENILS
jgi:hypothetical protein